VPPIPAADPDYKNVISLQAKNFFSAGATGSMLFCATAVDVVWKVLTKLHSPLGNNTVGLIIAFVIVLGLAIVVPEPQNYKDAGKMKLTLGELIWGSLNSIFVFAITLGLKSI
jgi:hypothetical protein